ncbi:hypothetical protein PQQ86_39415 [Paraburkholderia sediminicola]|uniref:hypothetical protein n=1 Tax=Paraburkholderia sediminicola TaxID=458836 RepID=UPI0038BDAA3A
MSIQRNLALALRNVFYRAHPALNKVRHILGWRSGGVYKRIDENRELAELLRDQAPAFLGRQPWVLDWLQANDDFLCRLAEAVPISDGQFPALPDDNGKGFPRPWPTAADSAVAAPNIQ